MIVDRRATVDGGGMSDAHRTSTLAEVQRQLMGTRGGRGIDGGFPPRYIRRNVAQAVLWIDPIG